MVHVVICHDFTSRKWYTLSFVMILSVGSGSRCHLSWFYQ